MKRTLLLAGLLLSLSASAEEASSPLPTLDERTARALARGQLALVEFGWDVEPPSQPGARPRLSSVFIVRAKGKEGESKVFRVESCAKLYERIRAHEAPRRLGSRAYPVRVDYGRIRSGERTLFDASREFCRDTSAELEAMPDEHSHSVCVEEHCSTDYFMRGYRLLSLVGPILSLDERRSEAAGGGPPYHGQDWLSFDLRTGKPAHPLDLVTEASLKQALRRDATVRELLGDKLDAEDSARDILQQLLPEHGLQGFAFYEYDRKKNRVALRIAFHRELAGLLPNEVSQLGLWVEPRADARRFFEEAAAGRGFFLGTRGVERELRGRPD